MRLGSTIGPCRLALGLTACWLTFPGLAGASPPASAPAPVPVIVAEARTVRLAEPIEALGTLKANESVAITSNVTETISVVHFDDGQRVAEGDLLVEMTSAEEHALLEEAQARVAEAQRQYDRVRSLVRQGSASESLLDERKRDLDTARALLVAIESRLADRLVKAPFDGVLGLRNISRGALVEPGRPDHHPRRRRPDEARLHGTEPVPAQLARARDRGPQPGLRRAGLRGRGAGRRQPGRPGDPLGAGARHPTQPGAHACARACSCGWSCWSIPRRRGDGAGIGPAPAGPGTSSSAHLEDGDALSAERRPGGDRHPQTRSGGDPLGLAAGDRVITEGQDKARPGQPVGSRAGRRSRDLTDVTAQGR